MIRVSGWRQVFEISQVRQQSPDLRISELQLFFSFLSEERVQNDDAFDVKAIIQIHLFCVS